MCDLVAQRYPDSPSCCSDLFLNSRVCFLLLFVKRSKLRSRQGHMSQFVTKRLVLAQRERLIPGTSGVTKIYETLAS